MSLELEQAAGPVGGIAFVNCVGVIAEATPPAPIAESGRAQASDESRPTTIAELDLARGAPLEAINELGRDRLAASRAARGLGRRFSAGAGGHDPAGSCA